MVYMIKGNNNIQISQTEQLKKQLKSQKRSEKKLQLNLRFLNLLFETLPSPVFYKNENGLYLGCNKAFETLIGKGRSDIAGKSTHEMIPKKFADTYHEMDTRLFETGRPQRYEGKFKNATGQELDVIIEKAPLFNEDGTIAGLVGVVTDITQRKQVEAAVRVSEEKFKKISSTANDAIVQMDDKGRIIFWNTAARNIFGYSWEEVKGKDLHQLLVPPRYLTLFKKGFKKFQQNGQGLSIGKTVELCALRKDGSEFEIELSLSSYKESRVWNSVGIIRDISGRKKIEKEKEDLILNLKKALDEIKTLKGIVPICAHCKKIRDDKGFWNHLELYLQEHSEAEFSHGICPDCKKEFYTDFS